VSKSITFADRLERLSTLPDNASTIDNRHSLGIPELRSLESNIRASLLKDYGSEMIRCAEGLREELSGKRDQSTELRSKVVFDRGTALARTLVQQGLQKPDSLDDTLQVIAKSDPSVFSSRVFQAIAPAFSDTCWLVVSANNAHRAYTDNPQLAESPEYQAYSISRSTNLPTEWGKVSVAWHGQVMPALSHDSGTVHMGFLEQRLGDGSLPIIDFTNQTKTALKKYASPIFGCPAHVEKSSGAWPNMQYEFWDHVTHAILA
jgi:hypothetical protein